MFHDVVLLVLTNDVRSVFTIYNHAVKPLMAYVYSKNFDESIYYCYYYYYYYYYYYNGSDGEYDEVGCPLKSINTDAQTRYNCILKKWIMQTNAERIS